MSRILNVNDHEANREAVTRVLQAAGFDVLEAATGQEALRRAGEVELVLLDVQLPDLDGFQVAERIRSQPATRHLAIVHLSAAPLTSAARIRGLELGTSGYLTHPIDPEELVATVRAVLRTRSDERQLRLSLERNSIILQHIADAVTAEDASGRFVYANDAAMRVLGYSSPDDFVSGIPQLLESRFELYDEAGAPFPPDELPGKRVLGGAPEATATIRWRRRGGGDERWTVVQSRPVKDDRGKVQLAINILHDVTERRRAEARATLLSEAANISAALGEYEETLERVVRLPVGRFADWTVLDIVDGQRVSRYVAHHDPAKAELAAALAARPPRFDALHTLAPSLFTGRAELVPRLEPETLRARARPETYELFRALGAASFVIAPLTVRGETFGTLSLMSATPGRFGHDDLRLAEDLAQRASLAVDNARLYHAAKTAAEVRKDLVAVVAHDLKNPLNAVGMATALLARQAAPGPEGDRLRRQTAILSRAAERMNRLIHDLLDVAAIDAGALSMVPDRVAAGPLLQETLDNFAAFAQPKALTLTLDPVDEELYVRADRERLLQALANLVGNAVKFTPDGGRVTLSAARVDDGVQFRVTDTGPGIEDEHLPHVFDRYWRVRKPSRSGTGLGLSIVKGIIEAHGGRVAVETKVGHGSTFSAVIPAAEK
jgi:signal transduction histidine kinase/PAS domain-containing protein